MPPARPARRASGRKRALIAGGAVLGLAVAGGAAFGAHWYLADGAQAAEALPDSTIGYVGINIDPSGQQLLAAKETLEKFPAWNDQGVGSQGDLREWVFDKIQAEAGCDDLDYGDDIEPWLGDRMAVAAVDTGGDSPDAVFVVQVKDGDAADRGLAKIQACSADADGGEETGGWVVDGDWAVVAETDEIAQGVVDDAADASLADDADFQKWTGEAGDAGIMTMYAAPAAGQYIADAISGAGDAFALGTTADATPGLSPSDELLVPDDSTSSSDGSYFDQGTPSAYTPTGDTTEPDPLPDELEQQLKDFQGLAGTVRFDDGSLELELAGDAGLSTMADYTGDQAGDVIATLPEDTAAALGLSFDEDWLTAIVDSVASASGGSMSADDLLAELSSATGLDLPADAETLAGDSAVLAVGSGLDPEAILNSSGVPDVPVALKVRGDADAIEGVLDKLRSQLGAEGDVLGSASDGDMVAIGPSSDYVADVVKDGGLGDTDLYQDVIRESDRASGVLFVNLDSVDDIVGDLVGSSDPSVSENLEPLAAAGMSAWLDGDVSHAVLRITTD